MVDKEQFCCVRCEQLFLKTDAEVIFRTGFYRSILALGCCKACYDATSGASLPESEDLFSEGRLKRYEDVSDQPFTDIKQQMALAL
ncbi:hypothetical protein ACFPYJ_27855 [Paenibacillus solisilvae]|uniref:Uncharacterized protein n=1 Tax=Paenibacillus solisilvae TaxID=2486751 RepID=A0ABW0W4R5_9BACL